VEKILLTHSHWDHIAEVKKLKDALKVPVFIHAEDAPNLQDPGSDGLPLYFPIEGVVPDGYLTDHEIIQIGKLKARVIHTPGHTPGCVSFYFEHEKVVITGDTLFRGSIGRLNFPKSRPDLMQNSLNKLAKLPKETRVIPGHGESSTIGNEDWLARAQELFGF
jgi:glyoxylase-like metal-dependent hydrolase (beta-lactamase superfamily II)